MRWIEWPKTSVENGAEAARRPSLFTAVRGTERASRSLAALVFIAGSLGGTFNDNTLASDPEERSFNPLDCDYQSPERVQAALQAAVAAGEIPDPTQKVLPPVIPRSQRRGMVAGAGVPTVTPDDIFFFEDTAGLLATNFSDGQLFNLMADATNAVLTEMGDNFDFVAFFLNFVPDHTIGAAFYLGIENNVSGIGQSLFNARTSFGIAGDNVEGWVMMWNQGSWSPGSGDVTQLVFGQEFEHRFGMFLASISGGRSLQGNDVSCGRSAHWSFKVDGQGSGMEIAEWVGAPTATRVGGSLNFNTDFGGVFSAPDLYLMGYVSPDEMDSLPSELRYLDDNASCSSPYSGTISTWGSADVVASNGARIPASETAQKDFRTAWVMFHLPEAPPTASQLQRVVDMLNDWSDTWEFGTLGRGTMDNTLGIAFQIEFPNGTPEFIQPAVPTTFAVQTINLVGEPDTSSGLLHHSANGGPFQTTPLTFLGGVDFEATLPSLPCTSIVDFYVTIDSIDGATVRFPKTAPGTTPTAVVAEATSIVFEDDFETDKGWTVSDSPGLADGTWDRGVPVGGGDRGDPATDFDGSGQCYLTDNVDGNSDVDGGSTTLTSPPIDLSSSPLPLLQYARWYTNDFGASPGNDFWVVEISSNDMDWVELENTNISTGWAERMFQIGNIVPLTDQVQVRFVASDLGDGSVVEAGVDAFRVIALTCGVDDCLPAGPVLPEPEVVAKNRYLSFVGGSAGRQTAVRVTFEDLPAPFDLFNDVTMWVAEPEDVSENGAEVEPITGFPNFKAATLQCEPFYSDWSSFGTVHIYHEAIVPDGSYSIQVIDEHCTISVESNFSAPLAVTMTHWGDTLGNCSTIPCSPPDGTVNIIDVVGILGRFISDPDSIIKTRADIEPATPDRVINISDVLFSLGAFSGVPYPFLPGPVPCVE